MKVLDVTLRQLGALIRSQRKLWLPFALYAFIEALLLGLVWLAPHPPFSKVLAPPIRYFFSDRVLHYPAHLWFLYHVMPHTHAVASTLIGAFMTGVACVMVRQVHEQHPLSLRGALVSGQVRYGTMLMIWILSWAGAKGMTEALAFLAPKAVWRVWASVGMTMTLQALLIYAIPAAVFERLGWWRAIWRGLRETLRYPVTTLIIVVASSLPAMLFGFLVPSTRVAQWMLQTAPELSLACVVARLAAWIVTDVVMTVAIAHLWWIHRAIDHDVRALASSRVGALKILQGRWRVNAQTHKRASPLTFIPLLCAAVMASGCSASYHGERLYWQATRVITPLLKDPSQVTPEQWAKAIARLEQVVEKVPGSMWAARAQLTQGSIYAAQKQYRRAREAYALVLQNYSSYPMLCLSARIGTAKTHEIEQNFNEAIKGYRAVIDYHPWTRMGLEAPLYIAKLYEARHQSGRARNAYERAVQHYTKLIPQAPNPAMAIQVKGYLAVMHQQLGEWSDAIKMLEELAQTPEGVNRPFVLLTLGSIYHAKMHNLQRAQEIYATLSQEFPEHPFGKAATAQLARLSLPQPAAADHMAASVTTPVP